MTKVKDAIKMLQDYLDPNEEICIAWWSKDLFENQTHSDEDSKIKEEVWINVVNKFDDINYRIMSQIHSLIGHIDVKVMNGYYELSKSKEEIDKIEEFTQEEKTNLLNQISIAESYEYLCLFLIKYCNNFLMKI